LFNICLNIFLLFLLRHIILRIPIICYSCFLLIVIYISHLVLQFCRRK
jgi:hypothetical protein